MLDRVNKVKGYFKYTLRDAKTREIIETYEAPNQIMSEVPKMYFELVSGLDTFSGKTVDTITPLQPEDFRLCSIALGNRGAELLLDEDGEIVKDENNDRVYVAKPINPLDTKLNAMKRVDTHFAGQAYQATWEKLTENESMKPTGVVGQPYPGCKILTEGIMKSDAVPPEAFNSKGKNSTSSYHSESGMDVNTTVKDGVITFLFELLEKSGNHIDWSEAALFVRHKQDPGFSNHNTALTLTPEGEYNLGTIFSMKTFRPVHKTSACVLELEWKLDFRL